MPSLLDQRPVRRNPALFGQALVAQQRAQQEALNRAQRGAEFEAREGRMAEAQAARVAQNESVLALRERATALAERMERAKLTAAEAQLKRKESQVSAFTKAMKAIGSIAADDEQAEFKIADILANNAAALDEDNSELSGMLKERVTSLQKNVSDRRAVLEKRAMEAAKMNALVGVGAVPTGGNVDGITMRVPEQQEGMTFSTIEEAKEKFPGARLNFTLNEDGSIFVPKGGIPAPAEKSSIATALMGNAVAPAASPAPTDTPRTRLKFVDGKLVPVQ